MVAARETILARSATGRRRPSVSYALCAVPNASSRSRSDISLKVRTSSPVAGLMDANDMFLSAPQVTRAIMMLRPLAVSTRIAEVWFDIALGQCNDTAPPADRKAGVVAKLDPVRFHSSGVYSS